MKQLMKIVFAFALMISALGVGLKADAAPGTPEVVEKKPYEYEFKETSALFNGFTGAKNMVITFDKNINTITENDVRVERIVDGNQVLVPIVKSVTQSGKVLTITFKNLEFIDYGVQEDFKLVIPRGKMYFDQLTDYEFPFKFYDLLPGFESVFVNSNNASLINEKIFKHNEPRNVKIQVPPIYITKIETIHRYKSVVDPVKNAPSLSNIDVISDERATRLKVKLGTGSQYERDLDRSTAGVSGFSMGQAGITDLQCVENDPKTDTCKEYLQSDDFQLTAYSKDGRKLETKDFKMRVNDREKDFKISDYVTADLKFFGKEISLYDIMESPELLDKIVKEVDVRSLNDLAVVYSVGQTITVDNFEQFELALANEKLSKIQLSGEIELPTSPFIIDRKVIITGGGIKGDLQLGSGTDQFIRLENTKIDGTLTVDVGSKGTVVLDTVDVTSATVTGPATSIVSGGSNSVHLNNFKSTGGIDISNKTPLRIVTTTNKTNPVPDPLSFIYNAEAPVQLEVVSGKVILSLAEGNELAASNLFTVLTNVEDDVTATEDLTNSTFFILNEQMVEEDETTTATQVKVVAGNLPLTAGGMEFNETTINTRISEEEPAKGKLTGWKVMLPPAGWTVEKDELSGKFIISGPTVSDVGSIMLEAKDDKGNPYTMELKVEIID
ncbi:hypothetical protein ORD22_11070 [Sporosarcina sp. GW1-11]|uniref:hypothetical protein n=1 Tax=Sporosarcina sp. GW1-11 TaxID=2899126 RepID=UPI00294FC087|nr:hypothetical protein [Sporosarcina sp. GW1-11]MDV6378756.1 hypothetical protein [Sporosarcina sp. GW1-11]